MNSIILSDDVLIRIAGVLGTKTDGELANALGVASQTVSTWRNRNKVPYEQVIEVSKGFGVSTDYLLFGTAKDESDHLTKQKAVREWAENVVTAQLFGHIYEKLNEEIPLFEQLSKGDTGGFFYAIWSSYCALMRQIDPSDYNPSNWDNLITEVDKILDMDISRFKSLAAITKTPIERAHSSNEQNVRGTTQHITGSNHEIAGRDINKGKV